MENALRTFSGVDPIVFLFESDPVLAQPKKSRKLGLLHN